MAKTTWWDIKAYKTKEDYKKFRGDYLYDSGYTKNGAIKAGKEILKEGYCLVFVHSNDDEQIIPLHK